MSQSNDIDTLLSPLFRVLAIAFAITGMLFFLFPDGTIDTLNRAGSWLGLPPAPHLTHRFWLGLGTAYMAVVTVLAWRISPAPSERRLLMEPLMVGKATSSLTCLLFAIFDQPFFIYIANFVVDGALVGIVWWAWRQTAPNGGGRGGGHLDERSNQLLQRVAEAFLPPLDGRAGDAEGIGLGGRVAAHLESQGAGARIGGAVALRWLNVAPFVLGTPRTLSRLPVDERAMVLDRMERSRWLILRTPVVALKLLLGLHAYRQPDIRADIGVDDDWLNARLEQARARRAAGEKGPFPEPQSPDGVS